MYVVIDTNVLVSGIAYPNSPPGRIVTLWRRGSLSVVLSRYILTEFKRVLPRLSKKTLSDVEIKQLADTFLFIADIHEPSISHGVVRDSKDDPVLALLIDSRAEVLITGDKDLLSLSDSYPIMTPARFCEKYA